jgi:hypothetical protein
LISIAASPSTASIASGTTQQFSALGTLTDGTTKDVTATAQWTSDTPAVATVNGNGLATGAAVGSAQITATVGLVSGSAVLAVTPAQLVSIAVNPTNGSVPAGTTQQFTATGTFTDGSTQNVTSSGSWTSTNGQVATVSNTPGTQGLATALSLGSTNVALTVGSITGSATLNVTAAILVSISITPGAATITLGAIQQFTATGTYTDQSMQDVTSVVTWGTSDAGVATVSNTAGTNGLATSAGVGTANITASVGSISATATITVTPPAGSSERK